MSQRVFPPLPPELGAFAEGDVSMLVATRTRELRPNAVRAVGIKVWPGAFGLTVYLPVATSARSVADLRDNGQVAITFSFPSTHETFQIKGVARTVREAPPDDRAYVESYREKFCRALAPGGLPPHLVGRLACWPAMAVDLDIVEVFAQTPGPGAGARMTAP